MFWFVQTNDLAPLAGHILSAVGEVPAYSTRFLRDYGAPPTRIGKHHHMVSVLQSRLLDDDRFEVVPEFAEFGRVHVIDHIIERELLLRSAARVKKESNPALFDVADFVTADLSIIAVKFVTDAVVLSAAGALRLQHGKKIIPAESARFVGHYSIAPDHRDPDPFDQGDVDFFNDIGFGDRHEGGAAV